ncbi:MAG TPA: Hsp20/alpha crystallin family protein [Candidatus Polarisedimenticolaceae bacterium]|nr:Hsp20/alpha crystallin family protein [Candidatus Polarisedimenticolaceae bacterium]
MNQTIPVNSPVDIAIEQVERLYRSITGRQAPPLGSQPIVEIPPEKGLEQHVEEQAERLVSSLTQLTSRAQLPGWVPPLSVSANPEELLICLDIPGVAREAVKVRVVGQNLVEVSGLRRDAWVQEPSEADTLRMLRYREQPTGEFSRTIPLPEGVIVERLEARLRDGVLEIRVPRHQPPKEDEHSVPVS